MKSKILTLAAKTVSLVASASAGTLCLCVFHQPKVPAKLIDR